MLQRLLVQNFLFIDIVDIDFKSGLTVITGETGAGKSILLECIKYALGGKLNSAIHNDQETPAVILLEFDIANMPALNLLLADNLLNQDVEYISIKRIFLSDKRSKFFINDMPVTIQLVKQLGELLVEYQGQHSQTNLLDAKKHIDILDDFAGLEDDLKALSLCYQAYNALSQEIKDAQNNIARQESEREYIEYLVDELDKAEIHDEEYTALTDKRIDLIKKDKYINAMRESLAILEKNKILDGINSAYKSLYKVEEGLDSVDLSQEINSLDSVIIELEEVMDALGKKISIFDEEEDINKIEDRLFFIKDLARKYRVSPENLGKFHSEKKSELQTFKNQNEVLKNLYEKIDEVKSKYFSIAKVINARRIEAAKILESQIESELFDLKMEKTRFRVNITTDNEKFNAKGTDQVEFLTTNNPGLPFSPLKDISSGGELSRFMLAIRVVLSKLKSPPVILFDEVDTGVGGAVADAVGDKLQLISKDYQLIVVTHHPQVASKANQHLKVEKMYKGDATIVQIHHLNNDSRQEELARMLSGKKITDNARLAAEELMKH